MYTEKARNEPSCRYVCLGRLLLYQQRNGSIFPEDSDNEEFKRLI